MSFARIVTLAVSALCLLSTGCGASPGDDDAAGLEPVESVDVDTSSEALAGSVPVYAYALGEVTQQAEAGPTPKLYLFREQRWVKSTGRPMHDAINAMLGLTPRDPDYTSVWSRNAKVRGIAISGDLATVDLTSEAGTANAGSEAAELSAQQLVYTATAANPAVKRVLLKINGQPVPSLWGHVSWSASKSRAPQIDVIAPIWVLQPNQDATTERTFTLSGTASAFEATLSWNLYRGTTFIARGSAMASVGAPGRGTYSVKIKAPSAGTYTVNAFERSAFNGKTQFKDSKTITIR